MCGGLWRRQTSRAQKEGSGETSPALFCRRSPAREPRAAAKPTGRSPWGDHKAQWGEFKTNVRVAHTLLVDPKCMQRRIKQSSGVGVFWLVPMVQID